MRRPSRSLSIGLTIIAEDVGGAVPRLRAGLDPNENAR